MILPKECPSSPNKLIYGRGGVSVCVLCSESVLQVHWTDRKKHNNQSRIRERMHRIRLTNRILGYYGLQIEDWYGSKFVLRDKKGRSELVQDLGSLWVTAAKLTSRSLDPLDPMLLQNVGSKL
jgi:hypothetical protein